MHVINAKGLTRNQITQLEASLTKTAKGLVGQEMMYDLADHVRAFLANYNAPPHPDALLSSHEQMVKRMESDKKVKAEHTGDVAI